MDEFAKKFYLVKTFCPLCETRTEKVVPQPLPGSIICMECGRTLEGHRRVSTADGETKIWVEYR